MASVLITGGAGFLGARLARHLLAADSVEVAGDVQPVSRVILVDRASAPPDVAEDERVSELHGDISELVGTAGQMRDAIARSEVVFHLAAAVSAECEADFDLGIRANLRATEGLFAACRAVAANPVVVFASSVAAFGASSEHPLPAVVDDQTMLNPQSSYGAQKVIGEQLLADYTRKGFLRGRAVRMMTVSVRPGRPNAAASSFLSAIIREPLAGQRAACPVDAQTEVALSSPSREISGLLCAASATDRAWGDRTPVNLPALTVTVGEMVAALTRVAGPEASSLIDWVPDPAVAGTVTAWPARFHSDRAARLGLRPNPDYDSVIRMHLADPLVAPEGVHHAAHRTVSRALPYLVACAARAPWADCFPLVSLLASLIVVAGFAGPVFGLMGSSANPGPAGYVILACGYVLLTCVTVFCNAALIHSANVALSGGTPSVRDGFAAAARRKGAVLAWGAFSGTVSLLMRAAEQRLGPLGRIFAALGGLAWTMVAFMVLPVIVLEGTSPQAAARRSPELLRRTWGQQLGAIIGIGSGTFLLWVPSLALFIVLAVSKSVMAGWQQPGRSSGRTASSPPSRGPRRSSARIWPVIAR